MPENRLPPRALEAEKGLLGAILKNPGIFDLVISKVRAQDFYQGAHRVIFQAMTALHQKVGTFDTLMVMDTLGDKIKSIGGESYLLEISQGTSSQHMELYSSLVKEKAVLREVLAACENASEEIYESNGQEGSTLLDGVFGTIFESFSKAYHSGSKILSADEIAAAVMRKADRAKNGDPVPIGLSTGYADLDGIVGGLGPGQLVILAGRPSMGKTTFMLNLLRNICVTRRVRGILFSMEATAEEVIQDIIAAQARINNRLMRDMIMPPKVRSRMEDAAGFVALSPLLVDDSTSPTVHDIRAKTKIHNAKEKIGIIAVDYLQLMRSGRRRYERRDLEVSDITAGLKALAKDLGVPVIALAQLNRSVESREGHRPRLSDLRESGSIEQDADLVMFMHRPGYYSSDPAKKRSTAAEVIVSKNRHGPVGTAKMFFNYEVSRFDQQAKEERGSEAV